MEEGSVSSPYPALSSERRSICALVMVAGCSASTRIQPERELAGSQMKANESKTGFHFLSFPFISFYLLFGIGTFQRVTPDSNKKNPFGLAGCGR
jgi:hypothetical protein